MFAKKVLVLAPAAALLLSQKVLASPDHGAEESEILCEGEPLSDYNLDLAIISVFVMLIISFIGAAFPALLAIKRHPHLILAIKFGKQNSLYYTTFIFCNSIS
jgi:hypothetical protein